MIGLKRLLRNLVDENDFREGSVAILDKKVVQQFINNDRNTFLVSFPRTGSHWLRMMMELYFERPSLVRAFYYHSKKDYLTLHTHDVELNVQHPTVIYLYRDPVETIFSQLNYYNEGLSDSERILFWSDLYGRHLERWLHNASFAKKKTVVTYEGMKRDISAEFAKVTAHFGEELDCDRLSVVTARITKEEVKNKTTHDPQVIQLKADYDHARENFRRIHAQLVWDEVLKGRSHLARYFSHLNIQ